MELELKYRFLDDYDSLSSSFSDISVSREPSKAVAGPPVRDKMVKFGREKKTKWKKKEDARNFLTDVRNTIATDSQEAKELRRQFFPTDTLVDRSNLLMPAAVAVPAIGDVESHHQSGETSDATGENSGLTLAAAYVEDAKSGRGDYGKASSYQKPRHAKIAFHIITNTWFQRLIYLTVVVHASMTFIEPPSFSIENTPYGIAAICIDLLCLMLYALDIVLHLDFLSIKVFWCKEDFFWNRVEFVFLCFFTVDWIILIVEIATGNDDIVQPFRALRLAMVLCRAKNLSHIYIVVQSIVFKLGGIVLIFLTFIVIYSCIGVHLLMGPFQDIGDLNITQFRPLRRSINLDRVLGEDQDLSVFSEDQLEDVAEICASATTVAFNESSIYEGTFDHIGLASYQLFILLTTENFPVFMFPAYERSKWYFFYFASFLLIGVFFLTAILLAIIANIYWEYNKKHVKKERAKQRAQLIKAWKILDVAGAEQIDVDDSYLLGLFRILKPKNSDDENRELIEELDPDGNGYLDWIQWITQLLNVLDYEKTEMWRVHAGKFCNNSCCTTMMKFSRKIVKRKASEIVVLVLILFHSVLFAAMWSDIPRLLELIIQGLRSFILLLFIIEMFIRFSALGCSFFKPYNFIDLGLVIIAVTTNLIWYVSLIRSLDANVRLWRGACIVISSLAIFFRLFFNSAKTRGAMTVFFRLFPIMWDLIVLFAIILYLYAVIGLEAFWKLEISDDTPSSDYFQYGCGLGFRDFRCCLIIMFQLLTTSNWHEIMNSVILTVDSYGPLVYFFSFYMVVNLVIMNLLVAIGLEAFNKFSQEEKEKMDEEHKLKKENKKKSKLTGRFLLKGVVDILSDTFATTGDWQQTVEEAESEQVAERNLRSAPPIRRPGEPTRIDVRPKSSTARLGGTFRPTRVDPLVSPVSFQGLDFSRPLPKLNTLNVASKPNKSGVDSDDDDDTDDGPPTSIIQRQKHLRKKLLERKKDDDAVKMSVRSRSRSLSLSLDIEAPPDDDPAKSALMRDWVTVVKTPDRSSKQDLLSPFSAAGTPRQYNRRMLRTDSHTDPESPTDKYDQPVSGGNRKLRKNQSGNVSKPKFRRVYHGNNWRSEVQDITIINKEELSELRKQLIAATNSPTLSPAQTPKESSSSKSLSPNKSALSSAHDSYQSEPHFALGEGPTSPKPSLSSNKSHQFLLGGSPVARRAGSQESVQSLRDVKVRMARDSQDSISSSDSENAATSLTGRTFVNAPLISVEEVPEPDEQDRPASMCDEPTSLVVPGRARRRRAKKGSSDLGNPNMAPGWLMALTKKYNVSITKTENGKEVGVITQNENGVEEIVITQNENGKEEGVVTQNENGNEEGVATQNENGKEEGGVITLSES